MTYQESLFDFGTMQDRSGTTSGHLRLPVAMKRGDCRPAAGARARGEQSCPFLCCRHHLIPEMARLSRKAAPETFLARRWEGEIHDTCALDVADRGPQDHDVIGNALSITRQQVAQREAEAAFNFRRLVEQERRLSENAQAQIKDALKIKGEGDARRSGIIRAKEGGMSTKEIAEEFGTSPAYVEDVLRRRSV